MTNPEIQKLTMKQLTRRPSWQQDTAVQLAGGCQKVATDRRPPTFSAASRKEGFIRMSDTAVFSSFTVKVPMSSLIAMPLLSMILAFPCWSPNEGRHTVGFPAFTVSRVAPHPQWVMTAATSGLAISWACGIHPTNRMSLELLISSGSFSRTD